MSFAQQAMLLSQPVEEYSDAAKKNKRLGQVLTAIDFVVSWHVLLALKL